MSLPKIQRQFMDASHSCFPLVTLYFALLPIEPLVADHFIFSVFVKALACYD